MPVGGGKEAAKGMAEMAAVITFVGAGFVGQCVLDSICNLKGT